MLALAATLTLRAAAGPDSTFDLPEPASPFAFGQIKVVGTALEPTKRSPRPIEGSPASFPWETLGLGRTDVTDPLKLRFRVFSQERRETSDIAADVTRMLLRLWQQNRRRWRLDNPDQYNSGAVDVYLCSGGRPGGEQFFGVDYPEHGPGTPVDVICIYDLKSFTRPVEMAREVAHEYGHAILAPVGGFMSPEDWANGYLGERLFLRWIRDAMAVRAIEPADVMQVDYSSLDSWVRSRVDPLVVAAASSAPNIELLHRQGREAMAAYHGLVLYMDSVLPRAAAARSMQLTGSTHAWDYPHACFLAARELERFSLAVPQLLRHRKLWIPLGKGRVIGSRVLRRQSEWAEIAPSKGAITVLPK